MPNVMAALLNIDGTLCSIRKVWLTPSTRVPCNNDAKTRKPLKFDGVPQTNKTISAISGPKFTVLCRHVEEILLLNKFFFRLSICALVAKIKPNKVVRWCEDGDFLHPVFPASHVQHISDMHSKFALRPHNVYKYGRQRHPLCDC